VLTTLADIGPTKLLPDEQERIRYAADSLIFCSGLERDEAALDALADIESLCRSLIESGRWEPVTAAQLEDDVAHCGPRRVEQLNAA
jgi:hypothetical protein